MVYKKPEPIAFKLSKPDLAPAVKFQSSKSVGSSYLTGSSPYLYKYPLLNSSCSTIGDFMYSCICSLVKSLGTANFGILGSSNEIYFISGFSGTGCIAGSCGNNWLYASAKDP